MTDSFSGRLCLRCDPLQLFRFCTVHGQLSLPPLSAGHRGCLFPRGTG